MNYFFTEYESLKQKTARPKEKIESFLHDILYIKCNDNCSIFVLKDSSVKVYSKTLRQIEPILSNYTKFVRLNRGYIVNLEYMIDLKFNCRGGELLIGNNIVSISRRQVAGFRQTFDHYLESKGLHSEKRLLPFISKRFGVSH